VVDWTTNNPDEARAAWKVSADEVINLLKQISTKISN
jgi:hypothetical protein